MQKKFAETKAGVFLKTASPKILDVLGSIIPDAGIFSVIKDLITKDDALTAKDKEMALELLKVDIVEMQEISKRWDSDLKSDSFLAKNVRPLTLIFFSISYVTGWFLEYPLDSITGLLSLIVAAYFGSRGVEKFKSIK
jgi:hypothetical protein|tara:strand:- start:1145 stop:1558 length:414 start_codon:yes stop_codon:yes gene_type:complete